MKDFIAQQKEFRNWKVLSHNQIKNFKKQISNIEARILWLKIQGFNKHNSKYLINCLNGIRKDLQNIVFNWEHQDKKEKKSTK